MRSTVELDRFVRDINRAARDTPKAFRKMQQSVSNRMFQLLDQAAPPDEEGRLRASYQKRSVGHGKEWVEKINKSEMEVGTSVYYAPMVNDGHVVGRRETNRGHRKTDRDAREAAARAAGKAWVEGRFFREAAESVIENEMPRFADEFTDDALREVMR